MLNLFIDSNIWLDLYHYSNDDLDEFSKLSDMRNIDINILLTEHIKDEVFRNRDTKPLCTESAEVLIRTESPIPI